MSNESIIMSSNLDLPKNEEKLIKDAEEQYKNKKMIPYGYIEVKLDSCGRLGNPSVLHFRNYSMEETLELSSVISDEEKYIDTLIKCLNNMVHEDFDCGNLHEKELEEVMLYIFGKFWSSKLENYQYYLKEDIKDMDEKSLQENKALTNINISEIKTKVLNSEFKEPIKIKIGETAIKFKLPRLKDVIIAREYINQKYFQTERELSDVKVALEKKTNVSYKDSQRYADLQKNKSIDFVKALMATSIVAFDDKKYESLAEKIADFGKIDLAFWREYQKVVDEKCSFGLNNEVEFIPERMYTEMKDENGNKKYPELSDENGNPKKIKRRFLFQSMDFLPTVELSNDTRASVSFGD